MQTTSRDTQLSGTLVQWVRWSRQTVRQRDTRMEAFDILMGQVPPKLRTALVVQAMNLAVGVSVWSSKRLNQATAAESRQYLLELMELESARWFGEQKCNLNERGNRIGESNPKAVLSDRDVDLMLQLRAEVRQDGRPLYSIDWLADKFECSRDTVYSIVSGRTRGQAVARVKRLGVA